MSKNLLRSCADIVCVVLTELEGEVREYPGVEKYPVATCFSTRNSPVTVFSPRVTPSIRGNVQYRIHTAWHFFARPSGRILQKRATVVAQKRFMLSRGNAHSRWNIHADRREGSTLDRRRGKKSKSEIRIACLCVYDERKYTWCPTAASASSKRMKPRRDMRCTENSSVKKRTAWWRIIKMFAECSSSSPVIVELKIYLMS